MLPSLLSIDDESSAPPVEGAGFFIRTFARVLDILVHVAGAMFAGIVVGILVVVGAIVFHADAQLALAKIRHVPLVGYLASLLGSVWLHVCSEGLHGSTLGKRICGLTVIREDGARPPGLPAALRRQIAFYLDAFFFGFVAARKMAESPRRQRLGDTWANTMVVRIKSTPAAVRPSTLRFLAALALAFGGDAAIVGVELMSRVVMG